MKVVMVGPKGVIKILGWCHDYEITAHQRKITVVGPKRWVDGQAVYDRAYFEIGLLEDWRTVIEVDDSNLSKVTWLKDWKPNDDPEKGVWE